VEWAAAFLVSDIKESRCHMNEETFVEEENLDMPMQTNKLPNGGNIDNGVKRFKMLDILLDLVRSASLVAGAAMIQYSQQIFFPDQIDHGPALPTSLGTCLFFFSICSSTSLVAYEWYEQALHLVQAGI
jgi:hypothetical protein